MVWWVVVGLVVLTVGAESLVRGASAVARRFGIAPLAIGLTVVAVGTSAPEVAVTLLAALTGSPDVGVGNALGSNVFNVLVVLGVAALVRPLVVSAKLVWQDVPIMIGASLLVWALAADGRLGRGDGTVLVLLLAAYVGHTLRNARRESAEVQAEFAAEYGGPDTRPTAWRAAEIAVGLVLLVVGGRWLVAGGSDLARLVGLSELVIGLTIVAAGTSLPELATSLSATWRGERDIAAGNAIGSNIFNLLLVLGVGALVAPGGLAISPAALRFDLPVMVAVAVACLPIVASGHLIARWEGLLFLVYYGAYLTYLVLDGTGHDLLPAFSGMMLYFVLPLTAVTVAVMTMRRRVAADR
jgi:cation:H+ antiporter